MMGSDIAEANIEEGMDAASAALLAKLRKLVELQYNGSVKMWLTAGKNIGFSVVEPPFVNRGARFDHRFPPDHVKRWYHRAVVERLVALGELKGLYCGFGGDITVGFPLVAEFTGGYVCLSPSIPGEPSVFFWEEDSGELDPQQDSPAVGSELPRGGNERGARSRHRGCRDLRIVIRKRRQKKCDNYKNGSPRLSRI